MVEGTGRSGVVRWRVLIAEDNAALRTTTNEILTAEGYHVTEAEDGLAALASMLLSSPDVLILDLGLPGVSGVDLLRQVDVPPPMVIISSGFDEFDGDEVARDVGAKVFKTLRKPVRPSKLCSVVAEAVGALGQGRPAQPKFTNSGAPEDDRPAALWGQATGGAPPESGNKPRIAISAVPSQL